MSGTTGANLPVRIQVEGAPQAEAQFNSLANSGQRAMQRVQQGAEQAGGATGRFGQIAGQAGFQIQDFAGQVSAGQSALVAFGQQASQFLGVFGTAGAIAGALVTVGVLAAQFLKIGENSEDAGEAIKSFSRSLSEADREGNSLVQTLTRIEARFMSAIEAARQARIRALGNDAGELGQRESDATLRSLNRDQEARGFRAQRDSLAGLLAPENGLSFVEERRIREQIRELEGQIQSAERDAENFRREALRLGFNRQRTEALLLGEVSGDANPNPGRADPPEREGAARAPREQLDVQAAVAASLAELTQRSDAYSASVNLQNAGLERAAGLLEEYGRQQELLGRLVDAGIITEEQFGAEVERTSLRLGQQIEDLERRGDRVDGMGRELGMTFSSAFEDAIIKGEKLSTVLAGIAQDIARIILRQNVTAPLGNALSQALAPIGQGIAGALGFSTTPVAGARASGGPVFAGNTYLVGERGPELLTMGGAGTVTPNSALGGQTVNLSLNIDARGAGPREVEVLRSQIPAIARAAVQDAMRRGGGFARDVRGA